VTLKSARNAHYKIPKTSCKFHMQTMNQALKLPVKVADYYILPIALPSLASFPSTATHYLYWKHHVPSNPTPEAQRSLFLVNIPIDSTDAHLKHLFSAQIGLPAGRIQTVQFEDSAILESTPAKPVNGKKSKKRKRENVDESASAINIRLPSTWDRDLHWSGSTAVVTFVDTTSVKSAVKAVRALGTNGSKLVWGEGLGNKVPSLGSQRM
jgi:ribosomal RNA-processing protein 7